MKFSSAAEALEQGGIAGWMRWEAEVLAGKKPRPVVLSNGARAEIFYQGEWPQLSGLKNRRYQISRFALLRRETDSFAFESAISGARLEFKDKFWLEAWEFWREPRSAKGLSKNLKEAAELFLRLSFLAVFSESKALQFWEAHDLWFHRRTRLGQNPNPIGATFRFATQPRTKWRGKKIALPRARALTLSLEQALQKRKSSRSYSTELPSLQQWSNLLWHSSRLRHAYPSGGGLYAIDVFLSTDEGFFVYNAESHTLVRLEKIKANLAFAAQMMRISQNTPRAVLTLAAQHSRVAAKYSGIAYSLLLKEAGALLQTLQLTATAFNLSTCILGSGPSAFPLATHTPVAEIAVG